MYNNYNLKETAFGMISFYHEFIPHDFSYFIF